MVGSDQSALAARVRSDVREEGTMNDATRDQPATAAQISADTNEFQNLHEIVRKARTNLDQNAWDYIVGGTETETTLRRNRMALDEIAFRPRVLRDVSRVDASTEAFGRNLRLPVMLAPVGALETFDPGAAATVVRGARAFGAAHMLSSVCDPGLEEVARTAPDALRIFQLYVRDDDAFVEDHVNRAMASGYAAFCLTVDTAHYSRRERDLAKRFVTAGRQRVSGQTFQMALDWRTVKLIKDKYKIPLILKGITTAEDAKIAVASRRRVDLRVESRRTPTRPRPRHDADPARGRRRRRRSGQDHDRRLVLPWHRCRQGDRSGRRSRRHRPLAVLGARRRRRGRDRADAGAA
jgi:hypothetical protein